MRPCDPALEIKSELVVLDLAVLISSSSTINLKATGFPTAVLPLNEYQKKQSLSTVNLRFKLS